MAWSLCSKNSLLTFFVLGILSTLISCRNLNNPPKIALILPYSQIKGVVILPEDAPLKTHVGIMEITDEESGPAGEVECTTDNAFINISLVYPKTYKIVIGKELDRETVGVFEVQIMCSDGGTPALTATTGFTVNVIDANDNSPIFGQSSYSVNVTEGADVGTFVADITATDADTELNGAIRYSLNNASYENSSSFIIDNDTGRILTNTELDREQVNQYTITVVATDSGSPVRSSTVEVTINVDDINDNTPVITTKEIYVKENQKPMVVVGTVAGSDLDVGKNAQLIFSKVENSQSSSMTPFLVQPDGEILSAVSLNREQMSQYAMEVEVKDRGDPRKSSTTTVIIIVEDINDNTPVITSSCFYDYGIENYTLTSNSSSSDGVVVIDWFLPDDKKVVYQVKAKDDDLGDNARIRFSVETATSGNRSQTTLKDSLFKINESTGEILLRRGVRKTDHFHQLLNISASDTGNPPLTSFCALSITVNVDIKQLVTTKTTNVKVKSHKKHRKYRNSASDLGFVALKYLVADVCGTGWVLIACIVVNYVFRL